MDRIDAYLTGVNLTLPYEQEYEEAYKHDHCIHLTHLFVEIQASADNGFYPYPVELIDIYDDMTIVAFDDTGTMFKYVLQGEEDMNGDGDRRWYSWVDVYVLSPSGSWIKMQEPAV